MNTLYKITAIFLFTSSVALAQNIEFEKSNFPDKKDQLKEAKRSLEDGKDAFSLGKKEYDFVLEGYVSKNKYYPVSRKDYQRAGDIYFKQAQPFLAKAQDFNPNNAELNYMLGVISFNLNPQSDNGAKYLEKALSLNDPKLPEDLTYFLGWACQFQLKWDDAIKYYQMQLTILTKDAKGNTAAIEDVNKKMAECKVGKKRDCKSSTCVCR